MNRVASTILVACGAALLATRLISPADSSPRSAGAASMDERPSQDAAVLETMKAEVERLRERTKPEPGFPPPSRDPFNFGRRPEPLRPLLKPATPPAPLVSPVVLPELVAILGEGQSDDAKRTVVFARGDNVVFVGIGETISTFRVDSVTVDGVVLVDRDSGTRYRLSLQ